MEFVISWGKDKNHNENQWDSHPDPQCFYGLWTDSILPPEMDIEATTEETKQEVIDVEVEEVNRGVYDDPSVLLLVAWSEGRMLGGFMAESWLEQ